MGAKPRYLWQQAVIRYIEESGHKKSLEAEKYILRWLAPYLDNKYLDEISTDTIESIIKAKRKHVSGARTNRVTALLSIIFRKANREWGWIDRVPYLRRFKETGRRLRWLTFDEADRLLKALPTHTADMAAFTLATGLRESNVVNLEWSQINMQSKILWIHADQSKNGKVIRVPLNDDAIAILRKQIGKHQQRVFTYRGNPVTKAGTESWRAVLRKLGINDFCWHGLRHTWASWHVQAGTPLNVLQELGGWSCYSMVQRYAHLAPEHLADHAARITGVAKSVAADSQLKLIKC